MNCLPLLQRVFSLSSMTELPNTPALALGGETDFLIDIPKI